MNGERIIVRAMNGHSLHPDLGRTFQNKLGFKPAATRAAIHASRLRSSGYDVKVITVPLEHH